ncbi:MAG: ATP-binding protein, partial [Promethearchaeota archaeon]
VHSDDLQHVEKLFHKEETEEIKEIISPLQIRLVSKSKMEKWIEISIENFSYLGEKAQLVTIIDLTKIKQREEDNLQLFKEVIRSNAALQESEQNFRLISESSLVGIVILQNNKVKYVNDTLVELLGRPKHKVLKGTLNDILKIVHPEDLKFLRIQLDKQQKGKTKGIIPRYQFRLVAKSKNLKWVEAFSKTILYEGKPALLAAVADITDQKQRDQENIHLLNQVKTAYEELESVNQELRDFAYAVSHDLKAPLRGIRYLVNWLAQDRIYKQKEDGQDRIDLLLNQVKRMDQLIAGILQYSKVSRIHEQKVNVDLKQLILEIITLINPPDHVNITLESTFPTITCEKTRISQVFQNLLDNAVKFMYKPQGEIKISCYDRKDHWEFQVADNGLGIDKKHHDRIFQIFQTISPKNIEPGTGIGLTLVKKIIEQEGGKIWLESKIGEGSTFYFTLPKLKEKFPINKEIGREDKLR